MIRTASVFVVIGIGVARATIGAASTQVPPLPEVRAVRATGITIDGRLSEEAWKTAPLVGGFLQRDPDEGKPATERTEVRVLYDDRALYVGLHLFDSSPSRITRRLARRDTVPDADWVMVCLDPRHDHFTGFEFASSAAGGQYDAVIYNDTGRAESWDAVWSSAVSMDDTGWMAEFRIPFSQLRYSAAPSLTWGINVQRFVQRKNEYSWLVLVPKKENGLASRMAHLTGLDGIPTSRHVEWLPYATSRGEFITPPKGGDPFNDGSRLAGGAGVDLKWGLTSNATLDATVNPDFGQVEVDPAVVNLTAFETFYEEKRPFFIEGAQTFSNFGRGGANSFFGFNNSEPTLFYSRRIGRAPQGSAGGDFVDQPGTTTIVGAGKLTGKTTTGWSIGLLDAFTAPESARLSDGRLERNEEVEPPTNYLVARVKRDQPRMGYGFLVTSVERRLRTQSLGDLLVNRAYVAGGDGYVFLDAKRAWVVTGGISGSEVSGSQAAILRLQRAPQRYYQRPDAPQVRLNPNSTSLSGWSGRVNLNRNSGTWTVNAALWGVSPGFESNDLGFHTQGDVAGGHGVFLLRKPTPDRLSRSRMFWIGKYWNWNFNRELQEDGVYSAGSVTFKNYWGLVSQFGYHRSTLDDRLTRGGPSMRTPAGGSTSLSINSDDRKTVTVGLWGNYAWNEFGGFGDGVELSVRVKPTPTVDVSVGPGVYRSHAIAQYVNTVTDPSAPVTFGARYIFSDIDQTEVSMTTRLNIVFKPTVSLQVYMQPLLSTGRYWNFKELTRPRAFAFRSYGEEGTTITPVPGERRFIVDPDGPGPAPSFRLDDPSFNFKSLRLNAIFRWEYRPGSTLYVVWTENRQDLARPGEFTLGPDTRSLFHATPDDVFLVKFSYWLGR
ncbi:MAG TPA: DUF5916 domain-containing protein [Vicinamibacterales bacterium]|jgi:hypothetical protein